MTNVEIIFQIKRIGNETQLIIAIMLLLLSCKISGILLGVVIIYTQI
jgi:hypothetical protein